jgi:hypothetical protein
MGCYKAKKHRCWQITGSLVIVLVSIPANHGQAVSIQGELPNMLDLNAAVVVTPADLTGPEQNAVTMLLDEVEKRSLLRWQVVHEWPTNAQTLIAIGPEQSLAVFAGPFAGQAASERGNGAEGYRLKTVAEGRTKAVLVVGNDARGVLFGAGRLLRELHMARGSVRLLPALDINTAPRYPLRGHQLGYRPKVNTYDGWTVAMFEQYIRDLAVFGANAIEVIPPRSDDAAASPHFTLPPIQMMAAVSQLAADYGINLWIWYPAMDRDYSDPETVRKALNEWGAVFAKLPRIDAVFVPGGDPGHTQPKYLLALLEKQTEALHKTHPNAQMWMSPQSFTTDWMNQFLDIMQKQQPPWLTGIVFGPQNRISLPDLRKAIPCQYPIRHYPDITHSIRCQYAVPDWDVAYAMTEEREVINPRPVHGSQIFRLWQDQTAGFITYSEGCNDDVNKIIWTALGWDPDADVTDVLRQYSRYFIGEPHGDDFAQALLALERNWQGPLLTNAGVMTTLQQVQTLEKTVTPQVLLNWRLQQVVYRAYYDAYLRTRLIYETDLEERAMDALRRAEETGSLVALDQAEAILDRAVTQRVGEDLRARVFEMAEALYQSIRMQLSVPRYKAIDAGRGANLDLIDRALNNRNWLKQRFAEVRGLKSERERLKEIDEIVNWTNPGPGGYYDDLGNSTQRPHLVREHGPDVDPEFRASPRTGFDYEPDYRLSWVRFAESIYDAPLTMRYANLDPDGGYAVRVVYAGDKRQAKVRLVADERTEIHPFIPKPFPLRPLEFDIPQAVTADGALTLSWYQEPGSGGAGRGCQVAEVWLTKKPQ